MKFILHTCTYMFTFCYKSKRRKKSRFKIKTKILNIESDIHSLLITSENITDPLYASYLSVWYSMLVFTNYVVIIIIRR